MTKQQLIDMALSAITSRNSGECQKAQGLLQDYIKTQGEDSQITDLLGKLGSLVGDSGLLSKAAPLAGKLSSLGGIASGGKSRG